MKRLLDGIYFPDLVEEHGLHFGIDEPVKIDDTRFAVRGYIDLMVNGKSHSALVEGAYHMTGERHTAFMGIVLGFKSKGRPPINKNAYVQGTLDLAEATLYSEGEAVSTISEERSNSTALSEETVQNKDEENNLVRAIVDMDDEEFESFCIGLRQLVDMLPEESDEEHEPLFAESDPAFADEEGFVDDDESDRFCLDLRQPKELSVDENDREHEPFFSESAPVVADEEGFVTLSFETQKDTPSMSLPNIHPANATGQLLLFAS